VGAHRTAEPFGNVVLAVAVTTIEVALIVSVMIAAPGEKAGLALSVLKQFDLGSGQDTSCHRKMDAEDFV
jgi:hypothetical protein